ncbi:hypothetical protein NUW58_g2796 [Xylaria curta]|uniref:Uncharacterized protein n=1 Tax=Xylaria curta TaxID=42375 RepID=A0ACC1PF43_9PEZI|nr:hypothetical protein NUW58_g2796 [Xylaria curta]
MEWHKCVGKATPVVGAYRGVIGVNTISKLSTTAMQGTTLGEAEAEAEAEAKEEAEAKAEVEAEASGGVGSEPGQHYNAASIYGYDSHLGMENPAQLGAAPLQDLRHPDSVLGDSSASGAEAIDLDSFPGNVGLLKSLSWPLDPPYGMEPPEWPVQYTQDDNHNAGQKRYNLLLLQESVHLRRWELEARQSLLVEANVGDGSFQGCLGHGLQCSVESRVIIAQTSASNVLRLPMSQTLDGLMA